MNTRHSVSGEVVKAGSVRKPAFRMVLLLFTFVTLAALFNIRKFPTMAATHWQIVGFSVMAVIMFLLPASLISAELATGWPQTGGGYIWVKQAFGQKWGFTAVWLQWFQMTIWLSCWKGT